MVHDLIVVGGGPGGAACARDAAKLGLDVLVVEKEDHPRRKICAGGFRAALTDLLDFDISSVIEREFCGTYVYAPSGLKVECTRPELTGYTAKRELFDHLLLQKASEAGAEVLTGVEVIDVQESIDDVRVDCRDGSTYSARYVVGADGVNSRVARKTGIKPKWEDKEIGLCIEAGVPMDPDEIMRITRGPYEDSNRVCIEIFFGGLEHGYSWCFPKKDEVSLGLGCLMVHASGLKQAWRNFVEQFEKRNGIKVDVSNAKAMRVPLTGPIKTTTTKRIMLIGDAAGFVSPATGEGIYYAIETGQMAASTISDILQGKIERAIEYQNKWKQTIGKQLKASNFVANMMFNSEANMELVVQMAASDAYIRDRMTELIGGVKPYTELRNAIMKRVITRHPLKGLRLIF
ncbi:MAG: NAD(P)/FAD-dependent oxidoreductase [Candidatus Thorarchaeota archaeon]